MNLITGLSRLVFLLSVLCVSIGATPVRIGAHRQPDFYPNSLPAIVTGTAIVTNGSPLITSSRAFRSSWQGVGGYLIELNGTNYYVSTTDSVNQITLTTTYVGTSGSVSFRVYPFILLRIYALTTFQPRGENYIIQQGAPGSSAWFQQFGVSVISDGAEQSAYIPEITLSATTDAVNPNDGRARYYAGFYQASGSFIEPYLCFESFRLNTATPTSWADICTYNTATVPPNDPSTYYTANQINNMLRPCAAGKLAGYASAGQALSCITLGSGLTLDTNTATLSASGGTASQTDFYAYDYGVRCDGSTDNTVTLATAQSAARTAGKRLILPAGTCRTQQLVLTDSDNIKGAGIEKTILRGTADQPVVTVSTTAFNARLEDVSISGDTSYSSQIGFNGGGTSDYWGLTLRNVWIRDVGSHGLYLGSYPFSVNFDNIHIDNPVGYLVYVNSPYAPGLAFHKLYLHRINASSTLKVAFRVRRGNVTCEDCNGIDNSAPPITNSIWAQIGDKSGTDGSVTNAPAFVSWVRTNFESFEYIGVDHLSSSVSAFKNCSWAYAGSNPNRIAIQYEMDDSGTITYSAWTSRGEIDDRSDFANGLGGYKNGAAIHANTLPPLLVNGIGINAGGVGTPSVNTYYDTSQSQLVPLMRADANEQTVTVTADKSFTRPVYGDIEVNCAGACALTIPWAGWYRVARPLTIRDISGNAATNTITITSNGGGTIGGTSSYAIRSNKGAVRLVPNATATDWRIVEEYAGGLPSFRSTGGTPNLGFFPTWASTLGELSLSSAIYQSGSDIALNGGNLVHVKGAYTFTLSSPSSPTNSLNVIYPKLSGTTYMVVTLSATPSDGCAEFSSGMLGSSGRACGQPAPLAFATLGAPANGTQAFCSDCQVTSPSDNTCASGGTGALAIRLNGVWKCIQ